jgi:hypothetical protein
LQNKVEAFSPPATNNIARYPGKIAGSLFSRPLARAVNAKLLSKLCGLPAKRDSQDYGAPCYHVLFADIESHDDQAVVDCADQQCANKSSDIGCLATEKAGAVEDDGSNRCELAAIAKCEAGRVHHA